MKRNWFLDYIRSFRVVQLAHYMTLPLTAAYQWFKFCQWFVNTFNFLVNFDVVIVIYMARILQSPVSLQIIYTFCFSSYKWIRLLIDFEKKLHLSFAIQKSFQIVVELGNNAIQIKEVKP